MKALLIFDGDCGICTATSEYIKKKDKHKNIEVKPYQILDLESIHPELNDLKASKSVFFVDENNEIYNRSRAIFETLKRLPGLFKALGYLLCNKLFTTISDPLYNLVAKKRGEISTFFGMKACELKKYE